MASNHIPEELFFEILKRLPVKTLIRFLSVSKSRNSLISSPSFSKAHQIRLNDVVVVERPTYLRTEQCILHRHDNTKTQLILPLPKSQRGINVTLLSVIHGVVFFTYSDRPWPASPQFIAFWNPIIKRHVSALLPPGDSGCGGRRLLGAGFDPSNNDFKAVSITYSNETAACKYYEVFSARAAAWKKKEWTTTGPPQPEYYRGGHVNVVSGGCCYLNGAIYWITDTNLDLERDNKKFRYTLFEARGGRGRPHGLVFFDYSSEEFGKMELPEQVWDVFGAPRVFVYRGLLSVITRESGTNAVDMSTPCGLWTMKKYGVWTKDLIFTYDKDFCEPPRRRSMKYEDVEVRMC